jgi:hypothetical protein
LKIYHLATLILGGSAGSEKEAFPPHDFFDDKKTGKKIERGKNF